MEPLYYIKKTMYEHYLKSNHGCFSFNEFYYPYSNPRKCTFNWRGMDNREFEVPFRAVKLSPKTLKIIRDKYKVSNINSFSISEFMLDCESFEKDKFFTQLRKELLII